MDQVIDAMMPFFKFAIVLFVIETVFDMFWREHKKAKREREREKKREKRRQEYQDRRMAKFGWQDASRTAIRQPEDRPHHG